MLVRRAYWTGEKKHSAAANAAMPPKTCRLSSSQQDKSGKTPVIHQCSQCDKSFPNKRELTLHQYIHKEKPNTTCSECNRNFPNEVSYKRHMRTHADRDKRLRRCQICPSAFQSNHELELHHREVHLTDKPFHCDVCGASFSWQANLQKHQRMHKPTSHICSVCNKGFSDSTSLRVHQRKAHDESNSSPDKPFSCKVCKKSFMYDFSYEAHLNSHKLPCPTNTVKIIKPKIPIAISGKTIQTVVNGKTIVLKPSLRQAKLSDRKSMMLIENQSPCQPKPFLQNTTQIAPAICKDANATQCLQDPLNLPPSAPIQNQTVKENMNLNASADQVENDQLSISASSSSDSSVSSCSVEDKNSVDEDDDSNDDDSVSGEDNDSGSDSEEESDVDNSDSSDSDGSSETGNSPNINNSVDKANDQLPVSAATNSNTVVSQTLSSTSSSFAVPTSSHSGEKKKVKEPPKKRNIKPLKYDFVMTEEKPFECGKCRARFRWEISYQIHCRDHEKNSKETQGDASKSRKRTYVPTYPPGSVQAQSESNKKRVSIPQGDDTRSSNNLTTGMSHATRQLDEALGVSMRMVNQSTQISTEELQISSEKVSTECQTVPCEGTDDSVPQYTVLRAVPPPSPMVPEPSKSKISGSSRIVSRNASDDEDFFESPSSPYDFTTSEQTIISNSDSHIESLRLKLRKNEDEGDFHVVQKPLQIQDNYSDMETSPSKKAKLKSSSKRTGVRKSPRHR